MIAIVDYGVGNLFSLQSSLQAIGAETVVTSDAVQMGAAHSVILPGVGAFGDAMEKLRTSGLGNAVRSLAQAGKPLLGICLGMQLLFETSHEFGRHEGLGLVPGEIVSLADDLAGVGFAHKVPHIGWNPLHLDAPGCPLLCNTKEGDAVYYVHSFYARPAPATTAATSEYGVPVVGAVQNGNVYGTQFHPEKSGEVGLGILRAFAQI